MQSSSSNVARVTESDAAESSVSQNIASVLRSDWPLPVWLTIVLAAAAIVIFVGLYTQERGNASRGLRVLMASLRFTLLALVVWMFAGWSWLQFRSDKPELIILLDRSASMDTRDMPPNSTDANKETRNRLSTAAQILNSLKPRERTRLERYYQIRWMLVDETIEPANFSLETIGDDLEQVIASGPQSRLGDSLSSIIGSQAGHGTAAIVFFSDGINTSGSPLSAAATRARSAGIPIYAVSLGQELAQPDARLADLLLDEAVFLGDQVTMMVTASVSDVAEANLTVRLRDHSSGEVLDQKSVKLNKQRSQQQVSLAFIPKKAGELVLQLEVSEAAGETNLENNVLQRSIQVQDKTLRVLLVQKQPSFEFRFLKHLLQRSQATDARSSSFELNSVLQESDAEYVEQDTAAIRLVPSDRETLLSYDVFIFGDVSPDLISRSAQQLIYEQVTNSGAGCIFIAGRDTPLSSLVGWPIGDLLPVQFDNLANSTAISSDSTVKQFLWTPTSLGSTALPMQLAENPEASAKIWSAIPPAISLYTSFIPKTGSQVLAVGVPQLTPNVGDSQSHLPLLISQFAGAGRVALQATDETYRWSSFGGSDRYHQRYWEQMLRWLSRGRLSGDGQHSRLIVEPRRAKLSQPIRFELQLGKDADLKDRESRAELTIEDVTGKKSVLPLAREVGANRVFSATKMDLPPGTYRAVVFQPSLQQPPAESFSVVTPPGEQANLRADWNAMRQLAEQSRGRFYLAHETQKLFEELPPGKPARLGSLPPIPIWNSPWVAAAFVIVLTSEWLLRRRSQML